MLHKSVIEYAMEPREYPLGTVVVVHRRAMNTRDENAERSDDDPANHPGARGSVNTQRSRATREGAYY